MSVLPVSFGLRPSAPRVPECHYASQIAVNTLLHPMLSRSQVAAQALDYASERLSQVQTVQVFAQQEREAAAFARLSDGAYEMSRKYALFQVGQAARALRGGAGRRGGRQRAHGRARNWRGRRDIACGSWQMTVGNKAHSQSPRRCTALQCVGAISTAVFSHRLAAGHCGGRRPLGSECGHSGAAGIWRHAGHSQQDQRGGAACRWAE